jgi:hypothetical protein
MPPLPTRARLCPRGSAVSIPRTVTGQDRSPAPGGIGSLADDEEDCYAWGLMHRGARIVAEAIVVVLGLAALVWAWHADLSYCQRHLMVWFHTFDPYRQARGWMWRGAGVVVGALLLLFVRPRAGRWASRQSPGESVAACARAGLAVVLALVASEVGMRILHLPRPSSRWTVQLAIGEPDDRYGWVFKASKSSLLHYVGRDVEYAIDAEHNRAPAVDSMIDRSKPTILFVGESLTAGHGLPWDETYPAIVGRELGVQVANIGVHGYGFDQAYLRLHDMLPTFEHPVAIVSIYLPFMIDRLEEDTHRHLHFVDDEPVLDPLHGFWQDLRLARAWRATQPYRSDAPYELAATIVRETDRLATQRGIKAFFLAPNQGWGRPRPDQAVLDELFTRQGLRLIDADFGFVMMPNDVHPDTASTRRLAETVVAALRPELASP